MSLWSDFLLNTGRPIHKVPHYFPIYERHFSPFVNKPIVFWEIGCWHGGSIQMWQRYFGPDAQIIGIDINPKCARFQDDGIVIRIGDQSDPAFLDSVLEEFGPPDIVLDDGSHKMSHIVATFEHVYPRIAKNGLYMVEDLYFAYQRGYEGGLRRDGTFIEICKGLIDELNGFHCNNQTEFTRQTRSIQIYDSIVVFERGRHVKGRGRIIPPILRKPRENAQDAASREK